MVHLIDKDTLVTEIERLKACNRKICAGNFDFLKKSYPKHYYSTEIYNDILSFLDTLKVKEVDLEKEIKNYLDKQPIVARSQGIDYKLVPSPEVIVKHFFELGLKTQKETNLTI